VGYKRTAHTVYVVYWPEERLLKVGYSERQRWKPFVARGAEVLALKQFSSYDAASFYEHTCHKIMRQVCPRPFTSAHQARQYLGSDGGGYRECYRMLGAMHPHYASALLTHHASAWVGAYAEENRTEQSTNGESFVTSSKNLALGNAREVSANA
jgi:hypothetical protein